MSFRNALRLFVLVLGLVAASAYATAQTVNLGIQSPPNAGGKCVEVPNLSVGPGARMAMRDCNNAAAQTFTYDPQTQELKIGQMCVEPLGRGDAQEAVGLGACNGAAKQHWKMVPVSGYYQLVGMNDLCLNGRAAASNSGASVQINSCNKEDAANLWYLFAAAAAAPPPKTAAPPSASAPVDRAMTGPVPPERVLAEIEAAAKRQEGKIFSFGRWFNFRTSASDPTFAAALGNHAVMLITILVQKPEQLPVRRVYLRTPDGRETPLAQVSSWHSQLDEKRPGAKEYGRYREDGFYLVPISTMLREGTIMYDFADRPGVALLQLPSKALQGRPDPGPPAPVESNGLKAFIARLFPGFPVLAAAQ